MGNCLERSGADFSSIMLTNQQAERMPVSEKGQERDQKHKWKTRVLEKERQGRGVLSCPEMLPPSCIILLFLGYTKLLMRLPRFLISAVTLGKCPHLSEPQSLTWKLGMMIVLILQTLRTKYFQDLMPGVSKGVQEAHVAASWWLSEDLHKESFTALYSYQLRFSGCKWQKSFLQNRDRSDGKDA